MGKPSKAALSKAGRKSASDFSSKSTKSKARIDSRQGLTNGPDMRY